MKKKKLFFIIPMCLLSGIIAILLLIFNINKNDVAEKEHQDFVAYKTQLLAANGISETDDGIYYVPFFTDTDGKTWNYNRGRYLVLNENFLTEKDDGYSFNSKGTFDIYGTNALAGIGTGTVSASGTVAAEDIIDSSTKIADASISKCIVDLSEFMETNTYSTLIFKKGEISVSINWNGYTAGDTCSGVTLSNAQILSTLGENQHITVKITSGPILSGFTELSVILLDANNRVIGYNIDDDGKNTSGTLTSTGVSIESVCTLALGYKNSDVATVVVYSVTATSSKWGKIEKPTDETKVTTDNSYLISWNCR